MCRAGKPISNLAQTPKVFRNWTNGCGTACVLCSSSIGDGVRPCIGSCGPWVRVRIKQLGWRVMLPLVA